MVGKVIHFTQVPRELVTNAHKTWIRVLISKDDGATTYIMRIFEVEPNGYIPSHKHPWEHEIFVLEGEGVITISEKEHLVKPGTAVFIPPNVIHSYRNVGNSIWRFICVIPLFPTAPEKKEQ